jgi:hypothetical protein
LEIPKTNLPIFPLWFVLISKGPGLAVLRFENIPKVRTGGYLKESNTHPTPMMMMMIDYLTT